jgi:hypothetical protein
MRKRVVLLALVAVLMFTLAVPAQARGRDTVNRDVSSEKGCATSVDGNGQASRGDAAQNDNAQVLYCDFGNGK